MNEKQNVRIDAVRQPEDPRLAHLAALLTVTFPDPNSVLGLDRIREFLAADDHSRRFHVLVAEAGDAVVGVTIFSYVPRSNCGFSEYIVADERLRGTGLGRQLFDARKQVLNAEAADNGHARCHGLFIEADSPDRTPSDFAESERETALEIHERLRLFSHLGFKRVDVAYVQPPLAPDKQAVDYMDLLFAPWAGESDWIPADWVYATVEPIWKAWSPATYAVHLAKLKASVSTPRLALLPLAGAE